MGSLNRYLTGEFCWQATERWQYAGTADATVGPGSCTLGTAHWRRRLTEKWCPLRSQKVPVEGQSLYETCDIWRVRLDITKCIYNVTWSTCMCMCVMCWCGLCGTMTALKNIHMMHIYMSTEEVLFVTRKHQQTKRVESVMHVEKMSRDDSTNGKKMGLRGFRMRGHT